MSALLAVLLATLPDHGHCEVCGRVVDTDERWCSDACKEKHQAIMRKKKRDAVIFVVVVAVLFIVVTLQTGF